MRRLAPVVLFAALSVVWTWPLALHFRDHIPGHPGDNFSFLWNLWWMREALGTPGLSFFHSQYLFSPFGVDLVNHPHTALQGLVSATLLRGLPIVEAENVYVMASIFLNAVCAYALVLAITGQRRLGVLAGVAFGSCPYVAAHLMGHFDLLTAWVIPLFALCLRRALLKASLLAAVAAGVCMAVAAYSAYYHVVYIALFAVAYGIAWWDPLRLKVDRRPDAPAGSWLRRVVAALIALDVVLLAWIQAAGGATLRLGALKVSAHGVHNPLFALWLLAGVWLLSRWRLQLRIVRPAGEALWKPIRTLAVVAATFVCCSLPLIVEAVRLIGSGRYVTQTYFWRSAPRGIDALSPLMGNPFHPILGGAVSRLYQSLGLDRIEAVGWLGLVPLIVLLGGRGVWSDPQEARRWKLVLGVFLVFALGPFLVVAGTSLGLPLPQTLARFIPLVDNARMPGRAMVGVYLALGVLVALRLAGLALSERPASGARGLLASPAVQWILIGLLAFDFLSAPIPLTALDRPAIYERLAALDDGGPVIEVPFGIGDGLSGGAGSQERRVLYYATLHGHPLVGGFIGRMPPGVADAYKAMPVVGNLLRLSQGEPASGGPPPADVPFRYLVLDTRTASAALDEYVRSLPNLRLIASDEGWQLYGVQGATPEARNQIR